ncbi:MAG TPA: sulfite exporter TauE/SafE family protein [Usitatibacter sp.]|nr:sulfite exporter TauE/SafE family protein [Usitatibacter sp.]
MISALHAATATAPWWFWPLSLFIVCFFLGIIAVPAGVGGGVVFVPIVAAFFPFHIDFVRGAGLLVALSGALAAGPRMLESGLANLRLALPPALIASAASIAGAMIGLILPESILQVALGATILGIMAIMALVKNDDLPKIEAPDPISRALGLHGVFVDGATGESHAWQAHRTPVGLVLFVGIGIVAGMFGLGAGWANVPVLNLVMGVPLKVAAGTSSFVISPAAALVYLNQGGLLPMIAAPSVAGMMLGSVIGAHVLHSVPARKVRRLVLALMFFAGLRALAKGMGWWA